MCQEFCSQGGVVSQHALQVSRPTPGGKLRGLAWGGSPGPHPGGSPGPHPVVSRHTPGGVSRHTPRGSPDTHLGGIPACTEADTPQQTATAVGSAHPTGMHSCSNCDCLKKPRLTWPDIVLGNIKHGFVFCFVSVLVGYQLK